jgi:hypothetical protein
MITNADIAKLAKVLAAKEDISAINERLTNVERIVGSHTVTLDALAKDVKDIKQDNKDIKHHLKLI